MNEENNVIDLNEIIHALLKNALLIIFITSIFTLSSAIYTKYGMKEQYESKTLISIISTSNDNNLSSDQFRRSVELAKRYSVLSKSETVLKEVQLVIKLLHNMTISTKELADSFTVMSVDDTDILRISVIYRDKNVAKSIAQSVTDHSIVTYKSTYSYDNVVIIDHAEIINDPVSPNLSLNTAIGGILGLFVSTGIVFLREFLNRKIKTQKDIEDYLGIPYFGSIPVNKNKK